MRKFSQKLYKYKGNRLIISWILFGCSYGDKTLPSSHWINALYIFPGLEMLFAFRTFVSLLFSLLSLLIKHPLISVAYFGVP